MNLTLTRRKARTSTTRRKCNYTNRTLQRWENKGPLYRPATAQSGVYNEPSVWLHRYYLKMRGIWHWETWFPVP